MVESISISVELLEQFERGNVLLFVGEGINRGVLPSSTELAEKLAARCDYPPEEPLTLPRVAGYYEMTRNDRHGLIQFLRDRLDNPVPASLHAHKLAAQLRPRVIVTTCYDRLLERALQEADIPYTAVVGNVDAAYGEEHKVLLVWLWGVLDQPDSIVVTEDDRRLFLEDRANLSDVLRAELARRTWLFVGFDAEDEWFRGFYDSVSRGLDRHRQRAYIFGATPGAYTRAWWEKRNAEILSAEVEPFLAALTDQLAARARPEVPAPRPITAPAEPLPLPEEPYKALVSYEAKDRAMFFGRDCETEGLTALVHAHRLVLLYGASGVGKTSLLQAGVIPRLGETEPGYTVVTVRALTDPVTALRAALRRKLPDVELPADDTPLVGFLATATRIGERPLVLVIDQFEEFFIRLSPEFRAEFIAELGALYDARDLPVKVVLSLREDYLARVNEIEQRIPEVFQTKMRLLPLAREQARAAIVCPVEALGCAYEPALVERLLDDLTREGVMPPQLQLVCNALFHHANTERRTTLTLANYEAVGGTYGVLRDHLNEELQRFSTEEQVLVRRVLVELVTAEHTKRVETLTGLCAALNADPNRLTKVLERLIHARLLCKVELENEPEQFYELSHEYLIGSIEISPEIQVLKQLNELLERDVRTWKTFGTLLDTSKLNLIGSQWKELDLDNSKRNLLLVSWLENNFGDEASWTGLVDSSDGELLIGQLCRNQSDRARAWAAKMIGALEIRNADLKLMESVLEDPNDSVRKESSYALAKLDKGAVLTDFVVQIGKQPSMQEKRAIDALGELVFAGLAVLPHSPVHIRRKVRQSVNGLRIESQSDQIGWAVLGGVAGSVYAMSVQYLLGQVEVHPKGAVLGGVIGLLVAALLWLLRRRCLGRIRVPNILDSRAGYLAVVLLTCTAGAFPKIDAEYSPWALVPLILLFVLLIGGLGGLVVASVLAWATAISTPGRQRQSQIIAGLATTLVISVLMIAMFMFNSVSQTEPEPVGLKSMADSVCGCGIIPTVVAFVLVALQTRYLQPILRRVKRLPRVTSAVLGLLLGCFCLIDSPFLETVLWGPAIAAGMIYTSTEEGRSAVRQLILTLRTCPEITSYFDKRIHSATSGV